MRILFVVLAMSLTGNLAAMASGETPKRTEISVTKAQRAQFKDLTQSLQMVALTPIIDRNDTVICLEVSEIKNPMISRDLKVKTGDCFSHIVIFKRGVDGKRRSERHSVLSPTASFVLYSELLGAEQVDVDLKRGKTTLPMSYKMN